MEFHSNGHIVHTAGVQTSLKVHLKDQVRGYIFHWSRYITYIYSKSIVIGQSYYKSDLRSIFNIKPIYKSIAA
jgi:hypothetical protein